MSNPPARTRSRLAAVAAPVAVLVIAVVATIWLALAQGASPAGPGGPTTGPQSSSGTASQGTAAPTQGSDPASALARRIPGDPTALGKVDAPVVMVAYSEFQCPFCGKFARTTEKELIKRYVDTGVLRIEWRDFPYLGPESLTAAKAARAAAAQGKFWAYHDALYAHQPGVNTGRITPAYLTGVAKTLGLNLGEFTKAMDSPATAQAVAKVFQEGQDIGVTGTPAFVINGEPIIGAQPLEVFTQVIDAKARAAAQPPSGGSS